ncbi:hypothetical protein [Anaeromyxobacter paludicola]|uniref:Lipoprotein n=1 Tax=Anaeromyxobacter paludicola TaxID=2918171 RepID=A0ABM7XEL3_9BACT|nr:hypothetical protein [Anaeromyxobacter paludicola]BDG10255.1 hypothetical protein AMPC_33680 [Anaeromyxobacter paludicola]
MTSFVKWAAGALAAAALAACGASSSQQAGATVRVLAQGDALLLGAETATFSVACTGGIGPDYQSSLTAYKGRTQLYEAIFGKVPVGSCTFSAEAAESGRHFRGSVALEITRLGDYDAFVVMQQDQDDSITFDDHAPLIKGLAASHNDLDVVLKLVDLLVPRSEVVGDSVLVLYADVRDEDGDPMTFQWAADVCGQFFVVDPETGKAVERDSGKVPQGGKLLAYWFPKAIVPELAACTAAKLVDQAIPVNITLAVTDQHASSAGGTASTTSHLTMGVTLSTLSAKKSVSFTADLNHWPDVNFLRAPYAIGGAGLAQGGQIEPGQETVVEASVNDLDGDVLRFAWKSDCGATFDPAAGMLSRNAKGEYPLLSTVVTAPAEAPASATCEVRLLLTDGRGGTTAAEEGETTSALALNVLPDPIGFGPEIVEAGATPYDVEPGDLVHLSIAGAPIAPSTSSAADLSYDARVAKLTFNPFDLDLDELPTPGWVMPEPAPVEGQPGAFTWTVPACSRKASPIVSYYFVLTASDPNTAATPTVATNYALVPFMVRCWPAL